MKKLLILLCVLALSGMAFADVIIGTGTSSQRPPMSTYYKYYRSAAVYLGSEISAGAGTITHLQWYCGIANTTTAIPTKIYLKSTASNTLAGDTWANQVTGAALVFDASVTANATGWYNYDITDTAYNGSDNLEVLIETVNTPYVSPYVEWRYTSTSPSYRFISNAADTATPTSLNTSYSRPNIKFVGISTVVYPEPTNHVTDFAAGTLNYTSVQLNWTGSTGAQLPAKYLIQAIKSPGTYASVADGTPVADDAVWTDNNAAINVAHVVGANTYTFTGLTANTAYEFKIWPYTNSLTDIAFKTDGTIPTVTASTLSTTLPIPYSQDFSASTSLPANWTGTMSVNATHGNGGGNGLTYNLYSSNTSCNIATNPIGPMAAVCELKFDYRLVNYTSYPATGTTLGASDNIQVQISANGGAYSTIYTINSTNHVTSNAYATITLPLTTYDTQTINVKFIGTRGAGDYYFDLDNIIVREPPDEAQFAINPTLTEAWAFGTIQTGTTLKKQFTVTNTGAASLNISSISTSDTYYGVEEIAPIDHALTAGESTSFYATFTPTVVGGPYSGTVTVTWSSGTRETYPISFTGSGIDYTISTFDPAYTEGFESVTAPALPGGWTVIDNNADGDKWATYATNPRTGVNCANLYTDYNTANDDYLVTPPLMLSGNQELKFWTRAQSTTEVDEISVLLSTTTPTAAAFTNVLMASTPVNYLTYTEYTVNLSAYSGTCYISFTRKNPPVDGWRLYLDDVTIREIPDVAMFSYSPSSIEFPFTAENSNSTYTNVVVSNIGGASLDLIEADITIIGTDADQFSWDPVNMPASLTAGLSVNIPVRFSPTSAGAKTATLRISYDGTDYDVALSGYAYGSTALFESFEGATFPPAGWANPGSWSRSTYTYYSGTASAYLSPSDTGLKILSTPKVTITGSSSLRFMSYCSSSTATWDVVYSPDRSTWTQVTGSSFTHPTTSVWVQRTIDLSSLDGNNYYLGIRAGGSSYSSYYVDNLLGPEVTAEAPGPVTQTAPADLAIDQVRRPTLTWTAPTTGGVPTGYKIYCDQNNPPTTLVTTVTASPYTFTTDLNWEATYNWMVVATNGAGDAVGSTTRSFTVMADPTIYDMPYLMTFDDMGTTFPPVGWSRMNGLYGGTYAAGTQWVQDDWLNVTTPTNKAAKINIYGTTRYGWLVTPPVAIPTADYELKFDMGLVDYNDTFAPVAGEQADDKLIVVMSDSPLMTSPTILREWNNSGSTDVYDSIPAAGENYVITLTGITGTKYFAFYGESTVSGGDNDLMVDNIIFRQIPAGAPDNVTLNSPTNHADTVNPRSVTLSWTPAISGGNPDGYSIFVGENPIDPANSYFGDYEYSTTNTTFDLSAEDIVIGYGQTLYWAVWPFNGDPVQYPDPQSPSFQTFDFTTIQDPRIISLPYAQNFDGVTTPALPLGWTGYKSNASMTITTSTSTPQSAPNNVYMYNSSYTTDQLRLITPEITVPMGDAKISFYARSGSAGYVLKVGTVSALDGTGVFTELASYPLTTTHTQYVLPLTGYIGTDQYICFQHGQGGTYRSIYIDNFLMEEILANDMAATVITGSNTGFVDTPITHNVTVLNNGIASQSNYTVYLKSVDTRAILATQIVSGTPLAPNASVIYPLEWTPTSTGQLDIYGEVVLTGDEYTGNNTTSNLALTTYPEGILVEGFESGTIPTNWTVRNVDNQDQWLASTSNPHTGTYCARVSWDVPNDDWLITPPLQVTSTTTDQISFWIGNFSTYFSEDWEVLISTTDTEIASFSMIDSGNLATNGYEQKTYNLDAYNDAIIYLAIRCVSDDQLGFYADDFIGPPIYVPATLSTPVVTAEVVGTSVKISWPAIPYAYQYKIYVSDDPYVEEFTYAASTASLDYTLTAPVPTKMFCKVIASSDPIRNSIALPLSTVDQYKKDQYEALNKSK